MSDILRVPSSYLAAKRKSTKCSQKLLVFEPLDQPTAGSLGTSLHRRLGKSQRHHLEQQLLGGLLEAFARRARQRDQYFRSWREIFRGQAELMFLWRHAAAFVAVVVVVGNRQRAKEAERRDGPIVVKLGGLAAAGAVNSGALVAVFFAQVFLKSLGVELVHDVADVEFGLAEDLLRLSRDEQASDLRQP